MSRPAPRPLATSLQALTSSLAPATTLARVQAVWEQASGPAISAAAHPAFERDVLAQARRRTPLMLLDDVMSELDAERRQLLAQELAAGGQSVIATTDLAHVPGASAQDVTRLRVGAGTILQEALAA